jgi:phenylpropionate dioxygenase-like ring-hydroxylating dioxygenase large terminal subunit
VLEPWKLEGLRLADTLEYDSPWNWKVMVEGFMESYHHLGPHTGTLQPLNPAQGTHAVPLAGELALLENPAVPGAAPCYVMQVFPALLFALVRDEEPFANWYEMRITGPDRVARYREILRAIHAEDIPMCEGVQRGVASRACEWNGRSHATERGFRDL